MPTTILKKLYADGKVEAVAEVMTNEQMQQFVGGYFEFVPSKIAGNYLMVNEDGLMLNLPENLAATELVRSDVLRAGPIRGNALLCK